MKGHEYLTSIGILHRDISENNIVLDLYPWQERGYLIDFDTATLQKAEKPTRAPSTQPSNHVQQPGENTSTLTSKLDEKKHEKEPRTVKMSPSLLTFSTDVNGRVLSLTYLLVCCWARGTRISTTWNRSFMCFYCFSSHTQVLFLRQN